MSSIGDGYENAVIESLSGRIQTELLNRKRWNTRAELASTIFEYAEVVHDRQLCHSPIGMLISIERVTIRRSKPA